MLHADSTKLGASFVAKRAPANPRELIITLVEERPTASKDELFDSFRELLDPDYQRAVDWYFFVNMYEYQVTNRNRKPSSRTDAASSAQAQVDAVKQRIVDMVLLDLVLPNGKVLREATGAECTRAGGWFAAIAKKVKPRQIVGSVLTEEQLQALRR